MRASKTGQPPDMKTVAVDQTFTTVVGVIAPWAAAAVGIVLIFRDGAIPQPRQILFTVLILLGAVIVEYSMCIVNFVFWKIRYNDRTLIYRSMFGRTGTFSYPDIIRVRRTPTVVYLYSKNARVTVFKESTGAEDFLRLLPTLVTAPEE